MNSGKQFPDGLSFLLGTSVTVVAFSIGHALAGNTFATQIECLQHWQTLATGIIALLVGGITVRAIRDQIDLARTQEVERTDRKLYAAQTALPAALSSLLDYSRASVRTLGTFLDKIDQNDRLDYGDEPVKQFPVAPASALAAIQTCIEFENGKLRESLAWPMRRVQILTSRQTSIYNSAVADTGLIVTLAHLNRRIADHLEFQVRLQKCFEYARGKQDIPSIDTSIDEARLEAVAITDNDFNHDLTTLNEYITELVARRNAGDDS
ncbi:MAG: hypothetical protein JXQ99_19420 [Hyphomicrobiaceae bacterium]